MLAKRKFDWICLACPSKAFKSVPSRISTCFFLAILHFLDNYGRVSKLGIPKKNMNKNPVERVFVPKRPPREFFRSPKFWKTGPLQNLVNLRNLGSLKTAKEIRLPWPTQQLFNCQQFTRARIAQAQPGATGSVFDNKRCWGCWVRSCPWQKQKDLWPFISLI